jgi:hypothetical protein
LDEKENVIAIADIEKVRNNYEQHKDTKFGVANADEIVII